ncbi:phosphate signaling complex protein PhoU [Nitrospina watsonii]|uniref:Phosphate-specific transport system accessory protein PhoU n=1 Tax=Nitrospina watsonii TaxID=1323948 RepID=A0ABM9HAJ7_9BACT|nr:phosphate signaling complex protein PhoU [Nitrospina watsonii]CAI2717135.1 Phosphate-specific transport system accessory protein PhoU [Nitrospina watsonii]
MTKHFERELDVLKKQLLGLSAQVEEMVLKVMKAVAALDARQAQEIIDQDKTIDNTEVQLEEECLKVLALHQPVAGDLRFVIATLKINNDLERVADLAVNIAERAVVLASKENVVPPFDFTTMAEKSRAMLSQSIDCLINMDSVTAHKVWQADDEIDAMNREVYQRVYEKIRQNPDQVEILINYISISRHLERIADYATNIAEDVIYLVEGRIVRHQPEQVKLSQNKKGE